MVKLIHFQQNISQHWFPLKLYLRTPGVDSAWPDRHSVEARRVEGSAGKGLP
jgi:hypothetical protein